MGGGFSSTRELKCPDGYDKSKFDKILKLYDKIDKNGNMVIEEEEIGILSLHHVKNRIMLLETEKLENKNKMENDILSLKLNYEKNKKQLIFDYSKNVKECCQLKENKDVFIDKKLGVFIFFFKKISFDISLFIALKELITPECV